MSQWKSHSIKNGSNTCVEIVFRFLLDKLLNPRSNEKNSTFILLIIHCFR